MEFKIKTNTNTTNNKIITEFLDFACNRTETKKAIKDFAQMFGKLPSGQKKTVQEFLWSLFQETNKIRSIHIAKVNTAYQKVPELEVTKIEHLIEELEKAPERSCKKIIDIAKEELEEKETENLIRTASASLREEKLRLCNRGRLPNLSRKIFLQTVWESLMVEEAMSERRW